MLNGINCHCNILQYMCSVDSIHYVHTIFIGLQQIIIYLVD